VMMCFARVTATEDDVREKSRQMEVER